MHDFVGVGLTSLIALVTSGGLYGFLTARAQRRKINVDSDVSLSASAMERMAAAEKRAARAENKADRLELEMQKMRRKFFAYELWADQHRSWDEEAATQVKSLGGTLRPAPQLLLMKEG